MLASKMNAETLDQSGIDLLVVALYAHPVIASTFKHPWAKGVRQSIRNQVKEAHKFVKNYPNWKIARSANEAKKFLAQGKKVIVLSLEGAHSVFNQDKYIDEFIDELGISIVTLMHLINTKYGGASFMKGFRKTIFTTKPFTFHRVDGHKVNPVGLSKKGRVLVQKLLKKKVWIDLSHASDQLVEDILPLLKEAGQPLLYTHTSIRAHYGEERALGDKHIDYIKKHGGFVGLTPSKEMLTGTNKKDLAEACPQACECKDGIVALSIHYKYLAERIGAENIALGSDFNGGVPHLPPMKCENTSLFHPKKGLHRITMTSQIWEGMKIFGAPVSDPKKTMAAFLGLWGRVR